MASTLNQMALNDSRPHHQFIYQKQKMELGTIIIGAIFLALAFSPVLLMRQSRKKLEKAMLQSLAQVATRHKGSLSKHEFFGDFAIGIDESNHMVFYVKQDRDKLEEAVVNLADMQDCKVSNISKTIKSKGDSGSYTVIDRLDLSFIARDKNKPERRLAFYSAAGSNQLNGELKSVEEWSKIVRNHMVNMAISLK